MLNLASLGSFGRIRGLAVVGMLTGLALTGVHAQTPPSPQGASAQVSQGAQLYQKACALCHGASGRDATVFPRPIWGPGHDIGKFGHAKGLFEYVQLMMPFDDPSKLDDAQKTAIVAYMLVRHGGLAPSATMPLGGDLTAIR